MRSECRRSRQYESPFCQVLSRAKGGLSQPRPTMDLGHHRNGRGNCLKDRLDQRHRTHTLYGDVTQVRRRARVDVEEPTRHSLTIAAGRFALHLQCLPPADLPAMTRGDTHRTASACGDRPLSASSSYRSRSQRGVTAYYLNGITPCRHSGGLTQVVARSRDTTSIACGKGGKCRCNGSGRDPGRIVPRTAGARSQAPIGRSERLGSTSSFPIPASASPAAKRHPGQQS